MDTSCTKHWWNEEVNSVDIIEGLSLILTSGLIEFDQYGVPSISSGVREARVIIIIIIIGFYPDNENGSNTTKFTTKRHFVY